jgi:hypothetical protein
MYRTVLNLTIILQTKKVVVAAVVGLIENVFIVT